MLILKNYIYIVYINSFKFNEVILKCLPLIEELVFHLFFELNFFITFLVNNFREDFKDYCEVCFREFGDRVKFWTTINEPYIFTVLGYGIGELAPGRNTSSGGDSATEPYRVGHNLILAHAHVVKLYREKFQVIFRDFDNLGCIELN